MTKIVRDHRWRLHLANGLEQELKQLGIKARVVREPVPNSNLFYDTYWIVKFRNAAEMNLYKLAGTWEEHDHLRFVVERINHDHTQGRHYNRSGVIRNRGGSSRRF